MARKVDLHKETCVPKNWTNRFFKIHPWRVPCEDFLQIQPQQHN